MEEHDGTIRLDYVTLDFEKETIVPVEAYCDLGELVLVTEPELNDAMTIAAYSSTETFISTVSAIYENQYSSTYSYYASNGSKIMNMKTTQYLDFYTNTRTRDTYSDIKSHWLRSGGVDHRAYCARPSGTFPAGYYPSNSAGNTFWNKMPWDMVYGMVKAIGYSDYIIDQYTYKGGVAAATQVIVWSLAGNHMDKWGQAATRYDDGYFWNNAYNLPDGNYWSSFYRLRDLMWIHGGKPSFSYNTTTEANANPVTPTYNSSTGKYTYTWTDTASTGTEKTYADSSQTYLDRYFSFDALDDSGNVIDGITFSISGATVTMTATPAAMATSDVITIRVNTPTRDFSNEYFGVYYSSSAGGQPVVSMFGGPGKPVYAWMAIKGVEPGPTPTPPPPPITPSPSPTPTPPPPPITPTPSPTPTPTLNLGTLTITKSGSMVASRSGDWKWVSGSSKWQTGVLSGVTFEVWTGSVAITNSAGTVIIAANTKVTNNATYGITGFNSRGQVVTGTDGKCSVRIPYGSYVIKEVSTPIGYVKSSDQNVTISSSSAAKTITNQPVRVAVNVTKKDSETGEALSGAVFGLYAGEAIYSYDGSTRIWAKDELIGQGTTDVYGIALYSDLDWLPATSANRTAGYKYYVKEISPPPGYKATDYVFEFTASTTPLAGVVDITYSAEIPNTPYIPVRIHKTTDDAYAAMVAGNACYDVAGAQFVLFETMAKARSNNAADRVSFDVVNASNTVTASNQTVLTVASDGYTPYIRLEPGKTYYVREIQAGKGYQLPEGDSAIHSIAVTVASQQTFTISNTPAVDPITLILEKTNYAGDPPVPLTGAQFQVQYYPGTFTESTLPAAADRTWVIQTLKSGNYYRASFDRPGSIVAAQSESFWVRTSSGVQEKAAASLTESDLVNLRFPFGTYVVTEIRAADGYLNDPTFTIGGNVRSDKLVIQIHAASNTDPTPTWSLADGRNVTDLPVTATNTATVTDTVLPTVTTTLEGRESDGSATKTPAAKHSVSLTDTVTISTLDDFRGKSIRAEGHLYLLSLEGTSTEEIGNGTVAGSTTISVDEKTEEVSFTYTFDAWQLYGRTLVAYVEVYDENGDLIASHTDIGDTNQQITFRENGDASFYKHGEQLVGVTYNPNGTVTFNYEEVGLTGVTFQVVAAEDIRNVHGELIYSAGTVVADNIAPSGEVGKEGIVLLKDLPFGSYVLKETASDGKHTLVEDTSFVVNADTGDAASVDHNIPNVRKTVTVSLDKVENVNMAKPVPGAKYALYSGENIQNYKGEKVLEKDVPVAYAVTDENGQAAFVTADGVPVDLPVGYIWYVRELYVPEGYDLDDTRYEVSFGDADSDVAHIDRHVDGNDGDGKVTDAQQPGEIVLTKLNATGNRLAGAKYVLEYALSESGPWSPVFYNDGTTGEGYVAGGCDSDGLGADGSLTTGSDGVAAFTGLLADGSVYYRVTEIRTPDGYQLLAENILVGTLPKAADETLDPAVYDIDGDGMADVFDERIISLFGNSGSEPNLTQLRQYNSDMRKHDVSNGDMPFNRRYILTYTVTNSAVLELPRTGANGFMWLPFACGGLLAAGACAFLYLNRRKKRSTAA